MNFSKMRFKALLFALPLSLVVVAASYAGGSGRGFDISSLDKTCKPCQDFYQFADGGWMANNPIPAAYPSWGRFNELAERNRDTLHKILEEFKNTTSSKGTNEQKIGDFYCSCMDTEKIESEGIKPLAPELSRIEEIKDLQSLQTELARLHSYGVNALFHFDATQDAKDSS